MSAFYGYAKLAVAEKGSTVQIRTRAIVSLLLYPGGLFAIEACSSKDTPQVTSAAPEPQYRVTASIQELMNGLVDPSADALWDSVAYIATESGIEDRRPRTDEQWAAVRNSAILLVEAANLLSMPGRRVAADSSHETMQQRINATHEGFVQFARNLQETGLSALAAIDARDAQGLMDAGGAIDAACEACHVTYWYPDQQRPGT